MLTPEEVVVNINQVKESKYSNLRKRILVSIIGIPLILYILYFSRDLLLATILSVVILSAMEWVNITKDAINKKFWVILGVIYICVPFFSVLKINEINKNALLWLLCIIWSTDIFAFFAGKLIKGPKLAPKISPNKTWSGLLGGVLSSILIGVISSFSLKGGILFFVLISALFSVLEQISDLTESKIKRIFNVKDSGSVLPGHGGILDRVDGIILTAPLLLVILLIFPNKF